MKNLLFLSLLLLSYVVQGQSIVTFQSDGLTLHGTLSLPNGNGPFPLAVLIGGSGPNDRDQTFSITDTTTMCLFPGLSGETLKVFRDLGDHLASKGFASLRYDKRSLTHGATLDPTTISPYDFVTDVHSAVDYARGLPNIDSNCIILIGFSQGASFPPLVARNRPEISAMISLSGPSFPIDSLMPDQFRYIGNNCGDSIASEVAATQVESAFAQVRAGTFPPAVPLLGVYPSFWEDWIEMTDSTALWYQESSPPALFIQGMDDYNVPPKNGIRFEAQVTRLNAQVVFFDSLNHNLTPPTSPFMASSVLDTITNWLLDVKATTGFEEIIPSTEFKIQTNPNSKTLQVRWSSSNQLEKLRVIDPMGRVLYQSDVSKELEVLISLPYCNAPWLVVQGISTNGVPGTQKIGW